MGGEGAFPNGMVEDSTSVLFYKGSPAGPVSRQPCTAAERAYPITATFEPRKVAATPRRPMGEASMDDK